MNYSKIKFYLSYIFYKLIIPIEVKKNRTSVFLAELIWILNRVFSLDLNLPDVFKESYVETKFGKFNLTPDVLSLVTVSPAFERLDTNYLENIIESQVRLGKNVLFVDIGAYFGDYSIRIGNKFRKNKKLFIYAIEPGTNYLSLSTLDQLKINVKINSLKNINIVSKGVGSQIKTNNLGIKTYPLDRLISKKDLKIAEVIIIKLDIDDYVVDGLKGIESVSNSGKTVYLLVEDFIKPDVTFSYLKKHNYKFIVKLTPYNSIWKKS